MSKIAELFSNLTSLSVAERAELRELVVERAGAVDQAEPTATDVAQLTALADAADVVVATEPEAVAASSAIARMAARTGRPARSPEAETPAPNRAVLKATGAMRGIDAGAQIEDRETLARGIAATWEGMRGGRPGARSVVVASATWEYPEDRRLGASAEENTAIIAAFTSPQALVATGGICAPVNIDYEVPTWATAERPLRDGLPAFEATRGGVRFVTPPDIGALAAATGIWTEATDASPGEATKPVLAIACGTEAEVMVDAVPTRLQFGNMQSRFAPEQVAANVDLAMAAAARIAENNLLAQIEAVCTKDVTSATTLGATRDLITVIDQAVAAYRWLHRLPTSASFTGVFPAWLRDLIRIDLARELAHDNSSAFNVLEISDAQVDALVRAHGVTPIWHLDGQPAEGVAGATYPLQGFAAQSGSHAINPFPTKVVWYLFPTGMVQFLDGGRLDLGVVRDATLDATNDMELFVETFEAAAFRGFTGGAIQFVSTLCANGGSAGTISTAGACA